MELKLKSSFYWTVVGRLKIARETLTSCPEDGEMLRAKRAPPDLCHILCEWVAFGEDGARLTK